MHPAAAMPRRKRPFLASLVLLLAFVVPGLAGAQDQGANGQRSTGLPRTIDWTFNFDAAWGSFGFANSLYTDPKQEVPQDLGDHWFEGFIRPALSATYTLPSSSEVHGHLSAAGEQTYGSAPELVGNDYSSFKIENLSIGWRSGKSIERVGENALEFEVGRTQYNLGHGFLLWDGAAEGGSRGGYWSNARKAFAFAAIGRFKPGPHAIESFFLRKDDLPENQTGTELWGANYEYRIAEHSTVGGTYMKFWAKPGLEPQRDGLDVFNARAFVSPWTPDLSLEFEYAAERNADALDANAWTLQGAYEFSSVEWKPKLSYRYAHFDGDDLSTPRNEAFDPLLLGVDVMLKVLVIEPAAGHRVEMLVREHQRGVAGLEPDIRRIGRHRLLGEIHHMHGDPPLTPSPPSGVERVGVRWGIPESRRCYHLTLPSLSRGVPSLSPRGERAVTF